MVMAALLTVLVSFPTVSQEIDYSGPSEASSPIVSSETSFDRGIEIEHEEASTVTVEKHDMVYRVSETPAKRVETLETPSATLETKLNNRTSIYVVSSPYGTLKKGIVNGRKISEFTGANRTKLESTMNDMRQRVIDYRSMARQRMLPDVEIRITRSKTSDPDERVQIDNDGSGSLRLNGWTLKNSDGDTYEFKDLEIPAAGTAMVYTEPESELNVTEEEDNVYLYGTGTDWDTYSENAVLFNVEGVKVAEDSIS